jgi:hypothetical protein
MPAAPPRLSKDLDAVHRLVGSVLSAVDDRVITEDEADAVIHFIADRFTARRLDEVLIRTTTPREGEWFAIQANVRQPH